MTMKNEILAQLNEDHAPPPLPEIMVALENKINDPDADILEISRLVESEPVLAGKLLRLANSVFFGAGRDDLDDLASAVLRLGIKMVLDMVYTVELPKLFNKPKPFSGVQFWKHSIAVAYLTRTFMEQSRYFPEKEEIQESYLSGLMHDFGIQIFAYVIPEEYARFVDDIQAAEGSLEELEQERFGIAHPELGAQFIQRVWGLSPKLVQSIKTHHKPSLDTGHLLGRMVNVANRVANGRVIGNGVLPASPPEDNSVYLELLGISQEKLDELVDKTAEGVGALEQLLYD